MIAMPAKYRSPYAKRRGTKKLDPVKAMVAQAVQHNIMTGRKEAPPLPDRPDEVEEVATIAISPLETRVRVKLYGSAPRYFTVTVQETRT
jgi:hypothetical protein